MKERNRTLIPESSESAELRTALKERLLSLNFHAFAKCMVHLLEKMGYHEARLAGRTDWRGRNRHGGYDAEATLPGGLGRRKVIVAFKQFDDLPIYQRNLDELRGVCLRVGSSEALLVTTGSVAPTVRRWQDLRPEPLLAPVRLLNGEMLLDKLIEHRVGVWQEDGEDGKAGSLGLDERFFQSLQSSHPGNHRDDCRKKAPEQSGSPVRVTISIEPMPRTLTTL